MSDLNLKSFGRMTVDILRKLIGPLVGLDAMVQAMGYIENAGAPTAVVPDFIGQLLFDTTNSAFYRAYATTAGAWLQTQRSVGNNGAPASKTVTSVLTIAQMLTRQITANPGGSAAATYTTDIGADIETGMLAAFPDLKVNDYINFSIINVSTTAGETVTLAAGASGVTVEGDMTVAIVAVGDTSSGLFRLRRTAASTYTLSRRA